MGTTLCGDTAPASNFWLTNPPIGFTIESQEKETIMWKVTIIESERGWGQRVDEVKEFKSYEDAKKFQMKFNSSNNE